MVPVETELGVVVCFGMAQDSYKWRAFVNAIMNLLVS
jgi:hypothetical protein